MSGMGLQIAVLGGLLLLLVLIVAWLRKASDRSKKNAPQSVQERLGMSPAADEAKPRRQRQKPRPSPGRPQKPAAAEPRKKRPEPEPDEDDEDDDEDDDDADERDDEAEAKPRERKAADKESTAAYKAGLAKTRSGFVAKLGKLFGKKKLDAGLLEQLEEVLFTADIGPKAADRIFQAVKSGLSKDDLENADKVWAKIRATSNDILAVDAAPVDFGKKPLVILTIGVNGVGKTTTIGKLAAKFKGEGKTVVLAAGDTFRAAATEQLEEWGKRADVPVVKGKSGQDPSSVIFEAVKRGVDEKADVVICDTAGRLQTNAALMDELKKVRRVCDKAMPGAPHETWMVLDATNGQNAISQAKTFKAEMEITGIVLTKLDGSSKGGVILGICDELKVPIRFVGIGEQIADLRPFDPAAFVEALYEDAADAAA
jgi:fused signal recognition particle receptor